ncbi:sugar phosphate isomerase/epimerase family protein [Paenibacillus faecalis]|uniref:sugar phosphate isomerase/epimerase family protein n=1 Tax=Paenibacillus faecalis TaxID=2079532 RepID=UPI000D111606|nr:sugar phosphate isomerase/epimerase [Paenibacillus faecalis]
MEIGIFAKTFIRHSVEEVLDAVYKYHLRSIQFNMSCAGLPSMPEMIDPERAANIRQQCLQRKIDMSAVSGTFNMAHPGEKIRKQGIDRLRILAEANSSLGTSVITLCTGSRNTDSMWRHHPDNRSADAWHDMMNTMAMAVSIAEEYDVTLGVEPELSNVVYDARKAKKLLDEIKSPNVKIVMDAANLYDPGQIRPMNDVLSEAFDLLGDQIVIAHAKDVTGSGRSEFVAAGQGVIDYRHYLKLLKAAKFNGALILHGLKEEQVEESISYVRDILEEMQRDEEKTYNG